MEVQAQVCTVTPGFTCQASAILRQSYDVQTATERATVN